MCPITQAVPEDSGRNTEETKVEAREDGKYASRVDEVAAFLKQQEQKADKFKKKMSEDWRAKLVALKDKT